MIRVVGGRLTWGETDVDVMETIMGAEAALEQGCPPLVSVLRLAQRKGRMLSSRAKRLLDDAGTQRIKAKALKKDKDYAAQNTREQRAFPSQRVATHFYREMVLPAYLNADKTGVGKTLQSLLWAHEQVQSTRTLIICKNIAKEQWAEAIRDYIGKWQKITIITGTKADQVRLAHSEGWVICHWQGLNYARLGLLAKPWGAIIADEAHLANNHKALWSKVLHKLARCTENRQALTAHPFSKNAGELFSILKFLYPKLYTSYWRFVYMHVRVQMGAFGTTELGDNKRAKLLRWELAPFTLTRTKQQAFKGHPRISRQRVPVELTKRGLQEYANLKKQFFAELDAMEGGTKYVPIINELSRLTRVRQYLIDPGLIGGREPSVKFAAVLDLIDTIGEPVVVFSMYKQAILRLGAFLTKRHVSVDYIHGGMAHDGRAEKAKRRFLRGDTAALLCVADAADTSLNLGKYGYVIQLDLPFTPRGLQQQEGRVDRPEEKTGKLVPTTAYRVVVVGSYEERLEQKLIKRDKNFRGIFTVHDLKELFT